MLQIRKTWFVKVKKFAKLTSQKPQEHAKPNLKKIFSSFENSITTGNDNIKK